MILSPVKAKHLIKAAAFIDENPASPSRQASEYWVKVGDKFYQFKYLASIAYEIATGEKLNASDFSSSPSTRNYFKDLGFTIIYKIPDTLGFFTKGEIKFFAKHAKKEYRKNNSELISIGEKISHSIFHKTNAWALALNLDDWEVKQDWMWQVSGYFKSYSWARIFKKGDKDKLVYFTVGVDSNHQSLIYKLDCQWAHQNEKRRVTDEQYEIFQSVVEGTGAKWNEIKSNNLSSYNWDSLIRLTKKFLVSNEYLYDEAVKAIWAGSSSEKRLARICWNENGWVKPSGFSGKTTSKDTHEGKYGYGHEEWLFDLDKTIDGYHYGFLEPVRKYQDTYLGNIMNITLYTKHKDDDSFFLVGVLKNAEVISTKEGEQVKEKYTNRGWISIMEKQIEDEVGSTHGFSNYKGVDVFNIKYKAENVIVYDELLDAKEAGVDITTTRYQLLYDTRTLKQRAQADDDFSFSVNEKERKKKAKKKFLRKASMIELEHLHDEISIELEKHLIELYGKKNVRSEHPTGKGTRVDLVARKKNFYFFYEIKTFNSIRASIRNAVGQLMEYSYWPDLNLAKELIVVSHIPATDKAKVYMKNLRRNLQLPVYYQQFDMDGCCLTDKI